MLMRTADEKWLGAVWNLQEERRRGNPRTINPLTSVIINLVSIKTFAQKIF
jgi:hypothetical protein